MFQVQVSNIYCNGHVEYQLYLFLNVSAVYKYESFLNNTIAKRQIRY